MEFIPHHAKVTQKHSLDASCAVCGDAATGHYYYGGLSCFSCRTFFRRCVFKTNLNSCLKSQNCGIKVETRSMCQYCRFQKCLRIGMDPEQVTPLEGKRHKREPGIPSSTPSSGQQKSTAHFHVMFEVKEEIGNALKYLNVPEVKSKPLDNLIKNIDQVQICCCQSIVYPMGFFKHMLNNAVVPQPKTIGEMLPLHSVEKCPLKMGSKFSTDFFKRLTERDQFMVLMSNLKMLQMLRMADYFKPGSNLTEQMCFTMFEQKYLQLPVDLPNPGDSPGFLGDKAIQMFQQIDSIQQLQLDDTSMVLVMVIALLNTPKDKENPPDLIKGTQGNLRHLLYLYLCSKMSPSGALDKVQKIDNVLDLLMSSEDISTQIPPPLVYVGQPLSYVEDNPSAYQYSELSEYYQNLFNQSDN